MRTGIIVVALAAACWAGPLEVKPVGLLRVDPLPGVPVDRSQRIISGNSASEGQFPYQALVHVDNSAFCGGSLITERTVLTAAHCAGGTLFYIYLGGIGIFQGQQIYQTTNKIVHPGYSNGDNDLALVILPQAVTISNTVRTVSLASGSDTFEGQTAIASGWGGMKDGGPLAQTLQFVDVKIISNNDCAAVYGSGAGHPSKICSRGPGNHGVCGGDSGGPLVLQSTGVQIGVMSFAAAGACEGGLPSGYARVTYNYDWIMANKV